MTDGLGTRLLGYAGLFSILFAVAFLLAAAREARFEGGITRLKGTVIAKEIRESRRSRSYNVTYRVTIAGKVLQRVGSTATRASWDALRVGGEVDVECVGHSEEETRMAVERFAGSWFYLWIATVLGVGGIVLLGLRIRRGFCRS